MFVKVEPLNISVSEPMPVALFGRSIEGAECKIDKKQRLHIDFVFDYYHSALVHESRAWEWLAHRNIELTANVVKKYRLGYGCRSLGRAFPRSDGRKSEAIRGVLGGLGILKASGYQFLEGDVIFPFFDESNQIVGAYGRRATHENRSDDIYYHHWIAGEATFFNRQALLEYEEIILCKSPLDALTLICAGIPNVISTMGLYSFDRRHLEILRRRAPRIILAFDNSDPGNQMAYFVSETLERNGMQCSRVLLPRNKDVNAFAQKQKDPKKALRELVDNVVPVQTARSA